MREKLIILYQSYILHVNGGADFEFIFGKYIVEHSYIDETKY
jgi:hypothetical protein